MSAQRGPISTSREVAHTIVFSVDPAGGLLLVLFPAVLLPAVLFPPTTPPVPVLLVETTLVGPGEALDVWAPGDG